MFISKAELQQISSIDTDICIIGAGAAGITIAKCFLGADTRVALIEAGGFEYDPLSQKIYEGEVIGLPYPSLAAIRLRYFGGTTNHWEGNVKPFLTKDFEMHPWLPNSGWPISKADLAPYYQEAFSICTFGTGVFRWGTDYWLNELNLAGAELDSNIFKLDFSQRMNRILPSFQSFGSYYRDRLDDAKNISVYLNLSVIELNVNKAGNRVTSVSLESGSGRSISLRAKVFVLATGGIENARMLLVSNSTIRDGIGNHNGHVGRHFCDHAIVHAGTLVSTGTNPIEKAFARHTLSSGASYKGQLYTSFEFQKLNELTSSFISLRPEPLPSSASAASGRRILNGIKHGVLPDNLLHEIGVVITDIDSFIERQYYKITDSGPKHYDIWNRIEPCPYSSSRVSLIDEKDRFGKQRVALNWRTGEIEQRTVVKTLRAFASEMGRLGIGRVRIKPEVEADWTESFHNANHHMCTTRMASNPKDGVVDADCRVFSMDNLYIAGSSVFSTAGSGTPTLTLVALALRLAEHLKGLVRE